jgi:TPR repeat protein
MKQGSARKASAGKASARILYFATLIAAVAAAMPAKSDSFSRGKAAFSRGNYVQAARLLAPCARSGNPRAQAMLGFMYENGLGAPQAYDVAVELYTGAAERGDPSGQYLLGLMYDKGHGVDRNDVLAYKWLNLAAAAAPVRDRENYLKIRNAVASKMSLNQVVEGQWLALDWRAKR